MSKELFGKMREAIVKGKKSIAADLAREALESGVDPIEVLEKGFTAGLKEAGDLFEKGELFLPELSMAGEAMKSAVEVLTPALREHSGGDSGKKIIVLGTVEGDIHEIGKNIVGIMLETAGFEVIDLGTKVPVDRFVEAARERNASIVGASALLTTTMEEQRKIVIGMKKEKIDAKVIVGGAPVTEEWAKEIGADGFAENAREAVELVKKLVGG
jgi:trimethylamine corrinoid protein